MATGPYFTQGLKFNAVLIISGALILFILSRTLSISLKNNEVIFVFVLFQTASLSYSLFPILLFLLGKGVSERSAK